MGLGKYSAEVLTLLRARGEQGAFLPGEEEGRTQGCAYSSGNQSRGRGRGGGPVRQVPGRRGGWRGHRPWGVRVGDEEGGAGQGKPYLGAFLGRQARAVLTA